MSSLCKFGLNLNRLRLKNVDILSNYKNVTNTFKKFTATNATISATVKTVSLNANKAGNKTIGLWLLGCSGMVAGAVVLGGVTRYLNSFVRANNIIFK